MPHGLAAGEVVNAPYRPGPQEPLEPAESTGKEPERQGLPLPFARPVVTRLLLGAIIAVFVVETIYGELLLSRMGVPFGELLNNILNVTGIEQVLSALGALDSLRVAQGEYWRLLTAMFLHIGILHILFNGWALLVFGSEVEALFGSARFTAIYFLAGLLGSVASFTFGPQQLSAGASGAIFGLVGADIAFYLSNRKGLGQFSQRQLTNLFVILLFNIFITFSARNIDYFAHIGGLIGGLILGFGMSPRYAAVWEGDRPRLINRTTMMQQALALGVLVVLLAGGFSQGLQKWSSGAGASHDRTQVLAAPGPRPRA